MKAYVWKLQPATKDRIKTVLKDVAKVSTRHKDLHARIVRKGKSVMDTGITWLATSLLVCPPLLLKEQVDVNTAQEEQIVAR